MTFYYCLTDENGVECVDQLADETDWTLDSVGRHAEDHQHVIYFEFPETHHPVSDGSDTAIQQEES